ncbi:Ig-like domain-containing protein (plasmid) [Pantoea agglomerans]|uniref:Ig-like domain-containing protein n=1 Tax=Enterobacter agglomerans TaxID=549 RepID=UPI001F39638D|nr:Ig-like domain-containing protein [Pantoea agglomerans]UIL54457.1 Ig-like domain-containing protein [Pantoea agglomerans]
MTITDGDTVIGEVTADDDGKWTFTPDAPLADGEHAIVVDGTGADGNAVSGDVSIIVEADGSDRLRRRHRFRRWFRHRLRRWRRIG